MDRGPLRRPALLLTLVAVSLAGAQSGTRNPKFAKRPEVPAAEPPKAADPPKLTDRQMESAVAKASPMVADFQKPRNSRVLDGNCPVALRDSRQLIPGKEALTEYHDGLEFRFSGPSERARFGNNRDGYVPVLGGLSAVAWKDSLRPVSGTTANHVVFGDRIWLFASTQEKEKFNAEPARYVDADLLLDGYSPVALVDREELVRGSKDRSVIMDGRRANLLDADEVDRLRRNPGRYYPTLGGIDPVSLHEGSPAIGLPRLPVVYKNRLYLFASESNKERFIGNPNPYADLDVAENGNCRVTQVEQRKTEPGHYGISAVALGKRYLFSSEDNLRRFLATPNKYVLRP
jgi:YHS domain-containing protein